MDFPRLHVVTGAHPVAVVTAAVGAAVRLGVPGRLAVQVRVEDDVSDRAAYELAVEIIDICRPAGVMCLVNDRLHIALAVGADGGHVGADDLSVPAARRVLGPAAVIGATCRDGDDARAAVAAGATYLGVGPAFPTVTKLGLPAPLGPDRVGAVARAVPGTPVVGIGGITVANAGELVRAGTHGVAVVGAVASAPDPGEAVEQLLKALS
ncbi:thiamine phosphate synthase [Actinoplanes sp. RD1]|uniref:thiamine phosphate synthase n=1 Tax=Actinoplanes sp. RD1 TaxID=3064538 RepID=UPI002741E060|nr:thiamine phosphate synthase [Actinoplanes sp. RD1]